MQEDEFKRQIEQMVKDSSESIVKDKVEPLFNKLINIPLSPKQFASITGRSKDAVYKDISRGKLPFRKNGASLYIMIKDITTKII